MNTKLIAAVAAAAVMGLSGCASMDRQTAGTIGGAAIGGVAGNALVGGPLGVIGGAAAGGYIGHEVTKPSNK